MRKSVGSKKFILSTIVLEVLVIGSALLRAFLLNVNPKRYFDEQGYVSWFSFLQILFAAYLAWKVYKSRESNAVINNSNQSKSYNFWAIITFGFLFLGLDEMLEIHENLDRLIHNIFQIKETAITDRIDSVIVLVYALIGIGILYWAKSELKKFKSTLPLFSIAFCLVFLMIFLDLLTDSRDLIYWLFNNVLANIVHQTLNIVEECCKIFAEGMFIITFHICLKISNRNKYNNTKIRH